MTQADDAKCRDHVETWKGTCFALFCSRRYLAWRGHVPIFAKSLADTYLTASSARRLLTADDTTAYKPLSARSAVQATYIGLYRALPLRISSRRQPRDRFWKFGAVQSWMDVAVLSIMGASIKQVGTKWTFMWPRITQAESRGLIACSTLAATSGCILVQEKLFKPILMPFRRRHVKD